MRVKMSKVFCKYGAPYGKVESEPKTMSPKLHLARMHLDSGGYDNGGAYWGHPSDIWTAWSEWGCRLFVRAGCRKHAKSLTPCRVAEDGGEIFLA